MVKLNTEEIQHLRRSGFPISNKTNLPLTSKRPLRRFTAWWETTAVEKFLEDVVFLLKNAALLDIINIVASVTIIISLITWWADRNKRWEDEIFSTWTIVKEARNDKSGITKLALERLLKNKFSLAEINLSKTNLQSANLQKADLEETNLQEARLWYANLQEAVLHRANLQKADLEEANLQKADLKRANLQEAVLHKANLQETNLMLADLQKADLEGANLQKAFLRSADFQKAALWGVNLQKAALWGVKNLTYQQIKSACNWEKGIYKGQWNEEKKLVETIEPENTNFIEELKKDKSSDPKKAPNCSIWDNKE